MKRYKFQVYIHGDATVYANDKEEAIDLLTSCDPLVAGNKLHNFMVTITPTEEEDV